MTKKITAQQIQEYRDSLELFTYENVKLELLTGQKVSLQLNGFQQYLEYQTKNRTSFQIIVDRQVGKTTFLSLYALQQMLLYPRTKILLFSGSYLGSTSMLMRLKAFHCSIEQAMRIACNGNFTHSTARSFTLGNSSSLEIAPATDSGVRSQQAEIILIDDYVYISDSFVFEEIKLMQAQQIIALA